MKDIPGYEGKYAVSKSGEVYSYRLQRTLKSRISIHGYMRLQIWKNGKQLTTGVHRLVAMAYIPNPNNYPHVNHIDSVRHNNEVTNLEWCTPTLNQHHAMKLGRNHALKTRKLTPEMRQRVREMRDEGLTLRTIATEFHVSQVIISDFLRGKTYKVFKEV